MTPVISAAQDWNDYWLNTNNEASYATTEQQALAKFWQHNFETVFKQASFVSMLDVACGNGIVTSYALEQAGQHKVELDCLCADFSVQALHSVKQKHPKAQTIMCCANNLPITRESVDLACSQFGLEYVGDKAFKETLASVKPGGLFLAVIHIEQGLVFKECQQYGDALQALQESQLLPRSLKTFEAGYAAIHKNGSRQKLRQADRQLAEAVQQVQNLLRQYTPEVCNQFILRVYQDIGRMYQRMSHYLPQDVYDWLESMQNKIDAYQKRMQAMMSAAMSLVEFEQLQQLIKQQGFQLEHDERLLSEDQQQDIAWAVVAKKGAD